MLKEKFIGSWGIKLFQMKDEKGNITYPYGENPIGFLHYHNNNYMSVILSANRPNYKNSDFNGTDQEIIHNASYFLAYTGQYKIKEGYIIHKIKQAFIPNWIGQNQKRFFQFSENNNIPKLSTPLINY